jgi:hypothetical protein
VPCSHGGRYVPGSAIAPAHDRLYKKYYTLIQKAEKLSKDQIAALENFLGMI